MSINLKGKTELEQGNGRVQTNAKRNGDGILVKENDSRINRSEEDVKDRSEDAVQVHQQQQSPQWSVVHWERFLHIKSIKVLLVENDDSTRHVVTALLRNLKYEVIVAANGLQAWKILEDLTNHIDIVLTEVVMPCLSGIGLLCKIMSHKTRKNIPVIMMSSHDAMGLVFKCLSKGAVDFLVKPVRKNELKNLWQHVWRRCHSSSGSGSESGTRTQKSIRSKSRLKSDNCSSSDDEDDNESTDLNIGAESDDDSSSQNSWAKEVDSSQAMSLWDQTAKFSDSTCAKLRSNVEIFNGKLVPVTAPKEFQERDEQNGNIWKGKSSVIGKRKGFELQLESPNEDHEKKLEIKNKVIDDSIKEPDIDLSLKRHRVFKDTRKAAQVDHSVLRRSELSAFSRYNKTSDAFEPPNGVNRNNSLIVCLQIMKNKSVCDIKSCPSGALLYLRSDGVKVDKGSITDKLSINPSVVLKDKLEATPAITDLNLSSVFSPMKVDPNCPSQKVILVETDDLASTPVLAPLMGSVQEHPVQHIHHHHHLHHFHNIDGLRPPSNHDDLSLSIFTGPVEDNTANHSLTKSGYDSKNGSNGQIGSSTFVHAGCTNVENGVRGGAGSGNGYASGSGGGNKIDRNKSAFREAALTRFRQKKKEQRLKEQRLGGVQVRYDDRKRLAERLRTRGRFARQMGGDGSNTAADS